jgi:hypothetical protein
MIGEVRDETNLTTAEIANPSLRSQYLESPVTDFEGAGGVGNADAVEQERVVVLDQTSGVAQNFPGGRPTQLFPDSELNELRARWDKAQIGFVDEPRAAVEQADSLVATVVKRIAEQFAAERADLEHQWDRGSDVSTEDLRQALRKYRSFFDRLITF